MDKENVIYIYTYTHTLKYYSANKKRNPAICNSRDGPDGIMLSDIIQTEKDKYCMFSHMESKKSLNSKKQREEW